MKSEDLSLVTTSSTVCINNHFSHMKGMKCMYVSKHFCSENVFSPMNILKVIKVALNSENMNECRRLILK